MPGIVADALNSNAMTDPILSVSFSLVLTLTFAAFLLLGIALKFWLTSRQIRFVALHRGQVPANFSNTISLTAHQKAADYTIAKSRLGMIEMSLGAATLLGWTLLGGLSSLNQVLLGWLGGGLWQQLALLVAFALISGLIDLPLSLYQTFVTETRFGFNKMTLQLWLVDLMKSSLVGLLIGLPLAALILWMMAATGTWWWAWTWGVWMGFNLLMLMIFPTWIAPLFNKFKPLEDETLKARVNALMQRCGFSAKGLFVMDGSKRSAHANAYFTGFGAAKRVVFYDTLLAKLSASEVDAVLAHELGHFKHKHVLKRIASMFALSLLGFALLGWLATQAWFYTGLGVQPNLNSPNDALALMLFLLASPVLTFLLGPLMAKFSRRHEFEADAYAVAHTSGPDLASALLKLYEDNASTLTPDPIYAKFYYSHPPATERLARMMALKPAH
jgi:STE24 endopeptidase